MSHFDSFSNTMKTIFGEKKGMEQIFREDGSVFPVTAVVIPANKIVRQKTKEKDGYDAVQVGFGARNEKNIAKAQRGSLKGMGYFAHLREVQGMGGEVGATVEASIFKEGDMVTVTATSKSKGFQGVVKRHGFGGGRRSHGQKHSEREPGSIGGGLRGLVPKGMRMAGRMGGDTVTVKGLQIIKIVDNTIFVGGAVPGRRGTVVSITEQK